MREYNPVEIGERIRKQRELMGKSRDWLADVSAISHRYMYDLELGLKRGSIDTMCRISEALNLPIDYLLLGEAESHDEYRPIIAMVERCPKGGLGHLENIVSEYLKALSERK